MKKKIITAIVIIAIFALGISVGLLFNNKNTMNTSKETNNEQETQIKDEYVVISNTSDKIYLVNDKYEKIWEYNVKNKSNYYNIVKVYKNYIYYTDNDILYRKNINTNENENLNIEMKDYWFFNADDNYVVYNVLFDVYQVELSTKKQTKLNIQHNNNDALVNGVFYYSDREDSSLKSYNLSTEEKTTIDKKARVLEYNSEYIMYANDSDDVYLFNANTKDKKKVANIKNVYSSGSYKPLHLYKNTIYYIENNEIKDLVNNQVLYTYNLKDNQEITESIRLSEDKFLLDEFTSDGKPCTGDICGPSGDDKYVLVDIKNNTITELTQNIDILRTEHEEYNIN